MSKRGGLPSSPVNYPEAPSPKKAKAVRRPIPPQMTPIMKMDNSGEIIPNPEQSEVTFRPPTPGPSGVIYRPPNENPGPSGLNFRYGTFREPSINPGPSGVLYEPPNQKPGPSGLNFRYGTFREPSVNPGPSNENPGPSGLNFRYGTFRESSMNPGPSGVPYGRPNENPGPSGLNFRYSSFREPRMNPGPSGIYSGSAYMNPGPSFVYHEPREYSEPYFHHLQRPLIPQTHSRTHCSHVNRRSASLPPLVRAEFQRDSVPDVPPDQAENPLGSTSSMEAMDVDDPLAVKKVESSSSVEREDKSNRFDWTGRM